MVSGVGCLQSITKETTEAQQYSAARYTVDTVVVPGELPVPVSEAVPGSFAVNQIVPAGEAIPIEYFRSVFAGKTDAELDVVAERIKADPPAFTTEERLVPVVSSSGELEALSRLVAPFAGGFGPLVVFLGTAIPGVVATYRERKKRGKAQAVADSMVVGLDQIFDGIALLPDREFAGKLESGMKSVLQRAQEVAGVAEEAAQVVRRLKTPAKRPIVSEGQTTGV